MNLIPLGSGQTRRLPIGGKAALLDRAAQRGLPVPAGVVLPAEMLEEALSRGLVLEDAGVITCPTPAALVAFLGLPPFEGRVAVRSAFAAEDRADSSLAGFFVTHLQVNAADPAALAGALCAVWSSAARRPGAFRRDVLVMPMVAAQVAGVAFTERDYEDDLVNYTAGTADSLVSGQVEGERLHLPKLWAFETRVEGALPPWAGRLQKLLRDVRRVFGKRDWDIEWADDGSRCWLLQIRPVTRPTRRDETFTIANHKEILPDLPSTFMTDIVAACAYDLFAYYRHFDPTLPDSRPFIEVFAGRPFINLSLLSEMMRVFGLPTRLVTDNIGGRADRDVGLNLPRMLVKIAQFTLPRFALAQVLSVQSAARARRRLQTRMQNPGQSFAELTAVMRWLYTALVTEMFSLTAAIGPMLLLLRAAGTLEEHNARQQTISTRLYADLEPLRAYAAAQPAVRAALEAGRLPDDAGFRALWDSYMAVYGHRGIYESDVARPRYREAPEKLFPALLQPHRTRALPPRTLKGWLTLPLWWQAGRTIRAREQWRHDCMDGFARARAALLEHAAPLVAAGVLPDTDSLWMLKAEEMARLDAGWIPDAAFWDARRAEIDHLRGYHLPDLLRRFDDLAVYRAGGQAAAEHTPRLHGISLTAGEVSGRAWVLHEPESHLPEGFDPASTILVARSVDAGWIPTFSLVAGAVVETGGDLSHGSIILREMGLPAVTNVHGITRVLHSGDPVHLSAGSGVIEQLR